MIQKAKCSKCGKERFINNKKGICTECVYKQNHNGKTPIQVQLEKQKLKPLKKVSIKYKPKKTGLREFFEEIWNERPHYCENENCRKFLGKNPQPINFSHRRSKGASPELKFDKNNIDLLCPECHYIWEFGDRSKIKLPNE